MKQYFALIALLMLATPADAAEWVRLETPNFVVFGQAGEKRTKEIAAEFERFREAIAHVLPSAVITSAVPTTVVVFDSQRAFAPYRPRYNGKPVMLSGYFMGSESDNMIALTVDDRDNALRIVFHEYTHLITANSSRALPAWANEGLAEFYSTFAVSSDGKGGVLGRVIPSHYMLLGQNDLLSLEQLLTVDRSSALYNEGQRRSIFYAQSWAMVHMFLAGEPNRSKEFSEYIRLTAGGIPALEAWRQAFGAFDANKELKRYLRSPTVRNFLYKFDERIPAVSAQLSRPKASDVDAVLAALLRYAAPDELELRLRRAFEMTPPSMLARALLGVERMRAKQPEEARKLLLEAATDKEDWLVQYYVATGLTEIVRASGPAPDAKVMAAAREALDAVLTARPQLPHALAMKADLRDDLEGVAIAARARKLAPGREDYVFIEARLRAEARDFATARSVLAPLMTPRFPPEVREHARRLMGQIVERERFFSEGSKSSRPLGADSAPSGNPPPVATPVFRELKTGEQRLEGTLEKIECSPNGRITLVIQSDGEMKRFTAAAFSDIDFISYRAEQSGSINCGNRKPADAIYLTWVPIAPTPPGVTGKPLAVEFLPGK
jgi:hypothetical protein